MSLNKLVSHIENSRSTIFFSILILLVLLLAPLHFNRGGVLHSEPQSFILNYLDERTLGQKIFDFNKNDWGFYQARELSYLFDLIDSYFIYFSIKLNLAHFYSVTYFLCLSIIVFLFNFALAKKIGLMSIFISVLLTGLFLSAPSIFFSNNILRSAKILTATFFLLIIHFLFYFIKPNKINKKSLFLIWALSLFLSMSDRQGYFLLLSIGMIFLVLWISTKTKKYFLLFLVFFISLLLANLYTYKLGPFIIEQITGLQPNLAYLKLDFLSYTREDPRWIISDPYLKLWSFFIDSVLFLVDNIVYFFGNLPRLSVLIGFISSIIVIIRSTAADKDRAKTISIFIIFFSSLFLILTMIFFTLIKEPQIVWPGIRRVYYSPSINLIILLFAAYISSRILLLWPNSKLLLIVIFTSALLSNIVSLPKHLKIIQYGVESNEYKIFEYSPRLLQCLSKPKQPAETFALPTKAIEVCERLRK